MFTSGKHTGGLLAVFFALLLVLVLLVGAKVNGDVNPPIFLTRLAGVITTYPRTSAFSVGTTTPRAATTTIGKLNVTLLPGDAFLGSAREGFQKAFNIGSTTTAGGTATSTADIFSVYRTGCIGAIATSSATPIKLQLSTTGATSTFNGTVYWSYGTCS